MNTEKYNSLKEKFDKKDVTLCAISKTKPASDIQEAYDLGQRIFGENRARELQSKARELPQDIEWHMVGHLQRNKVKYIAPFVALIHSVDKPKLLREINKRAKNEDRIIDVLLQVHIAKEQSKHGFDKQEIPDLLEEKDFSALEHVNITGLMGMATFTDDMDQVRSEFASLKEIFDELKDTVFSEKEDFTVLSMGMSGDYEIALEEGANMVRIGSLIFGPRD